MRLFRTSALQKGCAIFLVLAFSTLISAIDVNVCSSFNTGSTPLNVSIYQTNGLCSGFCVQKNYAFAITQQNSCWCSNFFPDKGSTVDVKECNSPCPAYPTEYCGGPDLFGYLLLNDVAPSGTKTAPPPTTTPTKSTASTSASTASSSEATSTSAASSSSSSSSSSSTSSTSETSTTSTSSSSSSTSESTSSTTSTPPPSSTLPSTSTTPTDGGGSSGTSSSASSPSQTADPSKDESGSGGGGSSKKSGLGTGATVGIAVGVVGGVLAIAGALLFWFLRRRRQKKDEYHNDPSVRGSSSGMVGVMPGELTGNSGSPASPVSALNRNSTILIDPRMDPFKQGLYIRGSHESLNTLRDDHDYSRRIQPPKVLRAVNPDPEEG